MGCKGLMKNVANNCKLVSLNQLKGLKCAIDGYAWLHKAIFTDVHRLAETNISSKAIKYFLKRLDQLKKFSILPIVIFDGDPLPSKAKTNEKRKKTREENRVKALECIKNKEKTLAWKYMAASLHIDKQLVESLIKELEKNEISYIVAPYEADAQLGYISSKNYVNFVVSEDSDLILYGCNKILFKLNDNDEGNLYDENQISNLNLHNPILPPIDYLTILGCISGCDYTKGIHGLGFKKGKKLIDVMFDKTDFKDLQKIEIFKLIYSSILEKIDYPEIEREQLKNELLQAFLTYKFQWVLDPIKMIVCRSYAIEDYLIKDEVDLVFLGSKPAEKLQYYINPHFKSTVQTKININDNCAVNQNKENHFDLNRTNWKTRKNQKKKIKDYNFKDSVNIKNEVDKLFESLI